MTTFRIVLGVLLVTTAWAGCIQSLGEPALSVRPLTADSQARFTVDAVAGDLRWGDILIMNGDAPFRLGPRMDHAHGWFEVPGKVAPGDAVAVGDEILLPTAGDVAVELRLWGPGTTLARFRLQVPDHTPPAAPTLVAPTNAAEGVARETLFQWSAGADPSGVAHELEYWVKVSADANAPPTSRTALPGGSYAVPADEVLLPGQTYRWHVRAVDGAGNVGPWSETWEFSTSV